MSDGDLVSALVAGSLVGGCESCGLCPRPQIQFAKNAADVSQGDLPILCKTLSRAGLDIVETRTTLGTATYGSVENLIALMCPERVEGRRRW